MSDWIRALAVSFARRLVQEVQVMDTMEELIRRECDIADELAVLVIQMEDEIIHTDLHPFCDDPACGCHDDVELIQEHLEQPFDAGLLTSEEYFRVKEGKQL